MERGAENRAKAALNAIDDLSVAIGIESGLVQRGDFWFDQVCVVMIDSSGGRSFGIRG